MIINDYVLLEMNQQRRTQVVVEIASARPKDRNLRPTSGWRRRMHVVPAIHPARKTNVVQAGAVAS